jgi:hypothetical protein
MSNNEPYIFLLDLDGTIIGDCSYQCDIYNIQEIIRKNIVLKNGNIQLGNLVKYKTLCDKMLDNCYNLQSKLLRPHFTTFMTEMKKVFPNSFFFIYTASDKTWAHKEISIIEKQNNTDQLSLDLPSAIRHHWQIEFKSAISEDWSCIEFSNSLDLLTFSLKFS